MIKQNKQNIYQIQYLQNNKIIAMYNSIQFLIVCIYDIAILIINHNIIVFSVLFKNFRT